MGQRTTVVFVVDDNVPCRTALGRLLRATRYQPRLYGSGEELLGDALVDETAGCLIVDLVMPGMCGLELLERLAAGGHRHPAIVLTACNEPEKAFHAGRLGACEFLRKPVTDTELLRAIENVMSAGRSRAADAARRQKARELVRALSPRERQTLAVLKGKESRKAVAAEIGVEYSTIKYYCAQIYKKLGVHSLTAALEIWDDVTSDT